jgi:hypothetical protein
MHFVVLSDFFDSHFPFSSKCSLVGGTTWDSVGLISMLCLSGRVKKLGLRLIDVFG